jgi:hypothetical protein
MKIRSPNLLAQKPTLVLELALKTWILHWKEAMSLQLLPQELEASAKMLT